MSAEPEERILLRLWGVRENGAHATSGGNQAGRFVFDNLKILRFRHGGVAVVIELKHFAFCHLLAGLAEHFVNPMVPEIDDLAEGFGVEIVADEDTDLVAPDFSGGSAASADIGFVDHIVVEQGRGMNKLHQTGELVMIATGIAAEAGRETKKKGRIRFPPLFRMWAATVLTSATLESRFVRAWRSIPSNSSRYASQTSAMVLIAGVIGA